MFHAQNLTSCIQKAYTNKRINNMRDIAAKARYFLEMMEY
jgi:hypothetical protein